MTEYKKYDCDYLADDLSALIDDGYRKWFIKRFFLLGKEEVLKLASIAYADGANPKRLFIFLVGREYNKLVKQKNV